MIKRFPTITVVCHLPFVLQTLTCTLVVKIWKGWSLLSTNLEGTESRSAWIFLSPALRMAQVHPWHYFISTLVRTHFNTGFFSKRSNRSRWRMLTFHSEQSIYCAYTPVCLYCLSVLAAFLFIGVFLLDTLRWYMSCICAHQFAGRRRKAIQKD